MTQFISAFEDFFKSIYELFASIIGTFVSLINTLISTVLNFFSGIVNLFLDVGKGAVDLVGGIGRFIAGKSNLTKFSHETVRPVVLINTSGNIVVLGVMAAGVYIYTRQQQGKPLVPAKKTN
ncbi:hypothetical protein DHEL01_v207678 [Diaporthe helianthi]|uniref:Uncharacterized protein n=1 Tax=Diaporthe helianthi TaxID=158607 RepID=A0A2P5HUK0_DIAHE|nr:hypothetical protein DHEL01_v207678 [Diaporthe helianthi]